MIAYSYPGSNEFLVGTIGEISKDTPDSASSYDFMMAPFDKANSDTYWFKFSSISSSRVFTSPTNYLGDAESSTTKSEYQVAFKNIMEAISLKQLDKAVLSRRLSIPRNRVDLYSLYIELKNKYPNAFTYLVSSPETGTWMGASPELVLSQVGSQIITTAIAGTQALKSSIDKVDWGEKEIQEHAYIESFLNEVLADNNIQYDISEKSTIAAGGVCHIHSRIKIQSEINLIKLSELIHPGPALSGYPVKAAVDLITKVESNSRQYYCGIIGPINSNRIDWFANIRCLQVHPNNYTLYIGGGITEDSELESEWEETNLKSNTLLSIIETATVL